MAFFPGTFDPFTLSHKGIVRAIRDLGYEVLLAIDEFSWSKKTQPHRIRRRLASIATADEFHVSIFPENFPVNIANPANLAALRAAFPDRAVAIVAGSDVVAGASSYRKPPEENSIHTFDHIIFRRSQSGRASLSGGRRVKPSWKRAWASSLRSRRQRTPPVRKYHSGSAFPSSSTERRRERAVSQFSGSWVFT